MEWDLIQTIVSFVMNELSERGVDLNDFGGATADEISDKIEETFFKKEKKDEKAL